jgi:hypothetical protein
VEDFVHKTVEANECVEAARLGGVVLQLGGARGAKFWSIHLDY